MNVKRTVRCVLLGAGGHALVLLDALKEAGQPLPEVALDCNQSKWGTRFQGIPILGGDPRLKELVAEGCERFIVAVGEIAGMDAREAMFNFGRQCGLEALTIIHPSAVCSQWANIGAGVQLLARSVVNAGATIGDNVIVNTGAIVEHDCMVGDHVHIASGAILIGHVKVGSHAQIGPGATIAQGVCIGSRATIAPGAVVLEDVPEGATVTGAPARTRLHALVH